MDPVVPPAGELACPGCGVRLPATGQKVAGRYHNSAECGLLYGELSAYTTALADLAFLHQHAVDAYGAQHAGGAARPIGVAFSLAGLYLAFERGFTGRQVQRAHMLMAQRRREWPRFIPPVDPTWLTVLDPLGAPPGAERDEAIRRWAASVWQAWAPERDNVIRLVQECLG